MIFFSIKSEKCESSAPFFQEMTLFGGIPLVGHLFLLLMTSSVIK